MPRLWEEGMPSRRGSLLSGTATAQFSLSSYTSAEERTDAGLAKCFDVLLLLDALGVASSSSLST